MVVWAGECNGLFAVSLGSFHKQDKHAKKVFLCMERRLEWSNFFWSHWPLKYTGQTISHCLLSYKIKWLINYTAWTECLQTQFKEPLHLYVCRGLMFSAEVVLGYRVSLVLGRGVLLSPNWFSAATSLKCSIDLLDLLPSIFFSPEAWGWRGGKAALTPFFFFFFLSDPEE